jgi:hypothetical protein
MQVVAARFGRSMPTLVSLVVMISRWEHDHLVPDYLNGIVLCAALRVSPRELGLPDDCRQ